CQASASTLRRLRVESAVDLLLGRLHGFDRDGDGRRDDLADELAEHVGSNPLPLRAAPSSLAGAMGRWWRGRSGCAAVAVNRVGGRVGSVRLSVGALIAQ